MVRTALGDQNQVPVLQSGQALSAAAELVQVALRARENNREGRQRNLLRNHSRHNAKRLRVRDHHLNGRQAGERVLQLRFPADDGRRPGVKDLANDLLLGQNQPSLGRG